MAKNLDVTNSNSDSNSILKTIIIILIVIGIAYLIYYLYTQNTQKVVQTRMPIQEEKYTSQYAVEEENSNNSRMNVNTQMNGKPSGMSNPIMMKESFTSKGPVVGEENMDYFSQDSKYAGDRNSTSFPKDQLTADELLPQDNSSLWAQVNPSGEGSLKDRNFLQSGYHIGINTVGQTLRNANLQLRSEPPCPQVKVSPWIQSTIEPDVSRLPFEIGGCA
jgi:cytoskeletal protein RodZ